MGGVSLSLSAVDETYRCMHGACMATKTISIDLKAYERLRKARQSETESFSQVIHRAKWTASRRTCGDLLEVLRRDRQYLPAKQIRILERAQALDTPPKAKWS